jgi:hypothetical protein
MSSFPIKTKLKSVLKAKISRSASRKLLGCKALVLFSLAHALPRWRSKDYTDKKENQIFLIYTYKDIQSGAVAKSCMRKGFLIYEEMCKYFPIYVEAISHI